MDKMLNRWERYGQMENSSLARSIDAAFVTQFPRPAYGGKLISRTSLGEKKGSMEAILKVILFLSLFFTKIYSKTISISVATFSLSAGRLNPPIRP